MANRIIRLRLPSQGSSTSQTSAQTTTTSQESSPSSTNEYTPSRPEPRSLAGSEYLDEEWVEKEGYHKWLGRKYLQRIETRSHTLSLQQMMSRPARVLAKTKEDYTNLLKRLPIVGKDLIITTSDGNPLLVFLKGGLLEPWRPPQKSQIRELLSTAVKELVAIYPPPLPPSSSDSRNLKWDLQHGDNMADNSADIIANVRNENVKGGYYFGVWKAQGHGNSENVVLTQHSRKTGQKSRMVTKFYRTITPVVQTLGILFEGIDKPSYDRYCANFRRLTKTTDLHTYYFTKRSCWPTLRLIINEVVTPHFDRSDAKAGYIANVVAGEFTGGELAVPELGVQVALQPDDVLFMRSRLLEHFLAPFSGERYAFNYFHHANLFEFDTTAAEDDEVVEETTGDGRIVKETVEELAGPETRARKRRRTDSESNA